MTPDDARRRWYQEMADQFTPGDGNDILPVTTIEFTPELAARLAGHFGRLALGQTVSVVFDYYLPGEGPEVAPSRLVVDLVRAEAEP